MPTKVRANEKYWIYSNAVSSLRADSQGISIVIPCLNESETIGVAIGLAFSALRRLGRPGEVIVADNRSSDNSSSLAADAGARVVEVAVRGYGAALAGGIASAQYPIVVYADADLSYDFQCVGQLVEPIANDKADLVLGTRLRGAIEAGAMPALNRYFGTPLLSLLIRGVYGIPTTDCNSGMRAIRADRFRELALSSDGMEFASEMLIRAAQLGLRYAEVPIMYRVDKRGRASHLKPWRDGWRHLKCIFSSYCETK